MSLARSLCLITMKIISEFKSVETRRVVIKYIKSVSIALFNVGNTKADFIRIYHLSIVIILFISFNKSLTL